MYEFWLQLTTKEYWIVSEDLWLGKPYQVFKTRQSVKGKGNLYRMHYARKHGWQPELVEKFSDLFADFKWIKVKRYVEDPNKSVEENFEALKLHHLKETEFLIATVRELAEKIDELENLCYVHR